MRKKYLSELQEDIEQEGIIGLRLLEQLEDMIILEGKMSKIKYIIEKDRVIGYIDKEEIITEGKTIQEVYENIKKQIKERLEKF